MHNDRTSKSPPKKKSIFMGCGSNFRRLSSIQELNTLFSITDVFFYEYKPRLILLFIASVYAGVPSALHKYSLFGKLKNIIHAFSSAVMSVRCVSTHVTYIMTRTTAITELSPNAC